MTQEISNKAEPSGSLEYPVCVYYVDLRQMYDSHVSWHWHEEIEFDIIEKGSARIIIGNENIELTEGNGIAINQNALHAVFPADDKPCTYYSIVFHPAYLFGYGRAFMSAKYLVPVLASPHKYKLLPSNEEDCLEILARLKHIVSIHSSDAFGKELLTKSELCLIWVKLLSLVTPAIESAPDADPSVTLDEIRAKQAITFIQDHHMQPITLDDIASSIPISRSECCRCFKRALSISPFEYLMKYRIYEAAKKIYQRDPIADSISDLAASVGFNNASYFSKLFKKYLNFTPLSYKRMLRENPDTVVDAFGSTSFTP